MESAISIGTDGPMGRILVRGEPEGGDQVADGDRPGRGGGTVPRKATKTARFLALATERHGSLASIPLDAVAGISADLAPLIGLHPGAARAEDQDVCGDLIERQLRRGFERLRFESLRRIPRYREHAPRQLPRLGVEGRHVADPVALEPGDRIEVGGGVSTDTPSARMVSRSALTRGYGSSGLSGSSAFDSPLCPPASHGSS